MSGRKAELEEEFECSITITGEGSGTKSKILFYLNISYYVLSHILINN